VTARAAVVMLVAVVAGVASVSSGGSDRVTGKSQKPGWAYPALSMLAAEMAAGLDPESRAGVSALILLGCLSGYSAGRRGLDL